MNNREFNRNLKNLSDKKGFLSVTKIQEADNDLRNQIINVIVKKRFPVVVDFLNPETDISWLQCMGYFYFFNTKMGYKMLGTCENYLRYAYPKP